MTDIKMNRQLGTKWFTFYTKVRPQFALVAVFSAISDFISYTDVYASNIWLILYLAGAIAQPILCLLVFAKSNGDYVEFVRFVKGVLLFEAINMSYAQGLLLYVTIQDFVYAYLWFAIMFVISFFLWYRLNVKYFKKRIVTIPNYTVNTMPFYQAPYVNNQTGTTNETYQNRFCSMCGTKLKQGSKFCHNCGAKVE